MNEEYPISCGALAVEANALPTLKAIVPNSSLIPEVYVFHAHVVRDLETSEGAEVITIVISTYYELFDSMWYHMFQ
jgi:hypothetical protein